MTNKIVIKGVLFDCDGVISQSPVDYANAWVNALAEHGLAIKPEDWAPLEGAKTTEIAKKLWEKGGGAGECDAEALVARKDFYYHRDRKFAFYPGIEDLIDRLVSKGVPVSIVTSSSRFNVEDNIPKSFLDKFTGIVVGEMLERGKPDPDPFLKGAELIKVPIEHCLGVENAPLGIKSLKAAGAGFCVAVATTNDAEILSEADLVVPDIESLGQAEIIQELIHFCENQELKKFK
ncbi:MAG: hypothetical protein COU10_03370 [Candidatus Harrisonbacteria bacterium CG10_big_fil_rev_8_21_14_0_10_45_28]|uniref:HAD family phosphatase n=1 Tax=Candidatus Harrisonbacteria bacterium CG10_big_fil_rev_8_21_14_0_10_45_28 TaxID=1974586 RepID=A0A2H0UMP8_9BACT|nr:MAG: hypothetical protein COU10_03370 [Candidatus Harrisonbacteria bacterium CG10_big_fil_rev_8_21_14_0_10_45_28]